MTNNWPILKFMTVFHKSTTKCPDTSEPVSKCLTAIRGTLEDDRTVLG